MSPKQEAEILMNAMLPVAERMLRQYGEFYPYGGYMKLDGTIVHVGGADPDTDHPKSRDLLSVLRSFLKEVADRNECKVVAVAFEVSVTLPHSTQRSNAVQVSIEHVDNYSVEVFLPYRVSDGELIYGETVAHRRTQDAFARAFSEPSDS